jgi:hypothetical protein
MIASTGTRETCTSRSVDAPSFRLCARLIEAFVKIGPEIATGIVTPRYGCAHRGRNHKKTPNQT